MKKILAIALALCMAMALSVSVFADDIDVSGMDVAFEWTEGKAAHDWWTVNDVFSPEDAAAFYEALNLPGAVLEVAVTNPTSGGIMTNFNFDWDGHGVQMAGDGNYPTGDVSVFASMDDLRANGKVPDTIENAIVQFHVYQDETDCTVTRIAVYVPAGAASAPADEPETTEPEAPADEPETTEPEAPAAEPEAPAAEPTAPSTGLALAVVPAVVAMAAAFISKKH